MARIETLAAYRCEFRYLQRKNPLKEELKEKIKAETPPEYTFADFINDFAEYTSSLAIGKVTERAILLPKENVFSRGQEMKKWRIVPYAGKQGKPFRIIKTSTGKRYDFGSDSAALYEHNIFIYQGKNSAVLIFHRQSGSGCKSIFLEAANNMLHEKGIKLEMELYLPLASSDENIQPAKLQLQYIRNMVTTDIAENTKKRTRGEIIQELSLNLESQDHSAIKNILQKIKMGQINQDVAFAKIKEICPNSEIYNDAEILFRIGKRKQRIRWGEFDSLFGNYDITERLHSKFKLSGDYLGALTELADEYYDSIVKEENVDEG